MSTPSTPLAMFRTIVGIGMMCALVIVGVYAGTAQRIADNEARALANAVNAVLPAASNLRSIAVTAQGEIIDVIAAEQALPAFLGFDEDGELVGAAITAEGMGYQDTIKVIYAYSFEASAIVGFHVLQSLETPGIGTKIKEYPFLANFEALDVSLDETGSALANPIVTVPSGTKDQPWQIDAITGATVSSDAVAALLDDSAQRWVPVLARDAVLLRRKSETQ